MGSAGEEGGEEEEEEERTRELGALSDIYEVLRSDAKQIVLDLEGGVAMWREASAGAFASAGFLAIIALTMFHGSGGNPLDFWGTVGFTAYVVLAGAVSVVLIAFGVFGFRRYYQLRRRYAGLFRRVSKLE